MPNYKEQLNTIEKTINERKLDAAKLEQQEKTFTEEDTKLVAELKECGIEDPNTTPTFIDGQKTEIESKLKDLSDKLGV